MQTLTIACGLTHALDSDDLLLPYLPPLLIRVRGEATR